MASHPRCICWKGGQKNREVSQWGDVLNSNTLFAQSPVVSGALSHATDSASAQLSKSIVTHVPAQIECGSTNTSHRLSHCHTTPVVPHSTAAVHQPLHMSFLLCSIKRSIQEMCLTFEVR